MRSLRSRLVVAWVLALAAALAVGGVLVQLYRLSSAAQSGLSVATLEQGCAAIGDSYSYFVAGWAGPRQAGEMEGFRRDLQGVVSMALGGRGGLEAGVWQSGAAGAGEHLFGAPAGDFRAALEPALAEAAREGEEVGFATGEGRLGLACPLGGPVAGLVAWVALRGAAAPGLREMWLGVGVLLALVLLSAAWLSALLLAWQRRLRRIETALAGHELAGLELVGEGALPPVPPTGERELDRIVDALNAAGARLAAARARGAALARQVAAGERLAALGRVAAGVAHEIRNPVAAMRLRAENALAGDAVRRGAALQTILEQLARLDRLSGELLAMTQQRVAAAEAVRLDTLLAAVAADHPAGVLAVRADPVCGRLDPALVRRVLDNLIENAVRHSPAGATVSVSAAVAGAVVRFCVADTGPGVDPALRETLFEPFVTGRPEGTGLGLAIARELAGAMEGRLFLLPEGPGAVFVLEVPWRGC
jgi:signal transduction histidine kinase